MARRGSANFSAMAPAMFARRALAQSLAREFGPQSIHVAFVVLDGVIDTDRMGWVHGVPKLKPDDVV